VTRFQHLCGNIFINMIRLTSLLTEISLAGVRPYTNMFAWSLDDGGAYYECRIGIPMTSIYFLFTFTRARGPEDEPVIWYFSYFAPSESVRDPGTTNWSVSHDASLARGEVDYVRLIRTAADAIIDFAKTYAPRVIDITGGDTASRSKERQKSRIYAGFIASNPSMLASIKYRMLNRGGSIWLVRDDRADSTGIEDT
jgi:hypothetical protein